MVHNKEFLDIENITPKISNSTEIENWNMKLYKYTGKHNQTQRNEKYERKNKRLRNNLEVLVCNYQEYQKDTEKKNRVKQKITEMT